MLQVLLQSAYERRVVPVPIADCSQTVAHLKASLCEQLQLQPDTIQQVTVNGRSVPDSEQLSSLGLRTTSATLQGSGGSFLFPNGWWEAAGTKAYCKVRDITWPPLRQADYAVSLAWVAVLLGLLLLTGALQP